MKIFKWRTNFTFRRTVAETHPVVDDHSGWFCLVRRAKTDFNVFNLRSRKNNLMEAEIPNKWWWGGVLEPSSTVAMI